MCFYDHGDHAVTLSRDRLVARKPHTCTNWACRREIAKGDAYERIGYVYDGSKGTEKYCERCLYYQALIYAHERSEGCSRAESWCPMEEIYEHMRDLGWKLPAAQGAA